MFAETLKVLSKTVDRNDYRDMLWITKQGQMRSRKERSGKRIKHLYPLARIGMRV